MKRWINLILVIIAGTVLASCTSKKDPRFDLIEQTIKSEQFRDFFDGSRVIFIVPNAGCEGCITTAERFVKENAILTPEIRTVFTGSTSKKSLRLKLGDDTYSHASVWIDKENLFYRGDLVTMYPSIVYHDGESVQKIAYISPEYSNSLDSLISLYP